MAFIDELIGQGGLPYGMGIVEEPKAHDEIDSLIDDNLQKEIMTLVMGTAGGGGAGKGLRQLVLALKGKIKGGKMIPSQPIRKGTIGGPNPSKLDILLNRLKDNPNIGGNINRVMLENMKKYKPKK